MYSTIWSRSLRTSGVLIAMAINHRWERSGRQRHGHVGEGLSNRRASSELPGRRLPTRWPVRRGPCVRLAQMELVLSSPGAQPRPLRARLLSREQAAGNDAGKVLLGLRGKFFIHKAYRTTRGKVRQGILPRLPISGTVTKAAISVCDGPGVGHPVSPAGHFYRGNDRASQVPGEPQYPFAHVLRPRSDDGRSPEHDASRGPR